MKDQFEQNIKSIVEEFSYDYDPKAWDALSKKLPSSNGGFSSMGKIAVASVLVVVSVLVWNNYQKSTHPKAVSTLSQKAMAPADKEHSLEKTLTTPTKGKPSASQKNNSLPEQIPTAATQAQQFATNSIVAPATLQSSISFTHNPLKPLQQNSGSIPTNTSQPDIVTALPSPNTHAAVLCKGPKIVLEADAINYEDGTPRIRINAETNASDLTWSADGALFNKKNRSAELLAFKGKTYTITASAQLDGCTSTEHIKITANEDYNLLAVNAFNTQSRDERNATFMPYALTIRDVRFELIVLDPDNGAVVFKTSDAQNAWDGIDQRNGQLVPAQKAYIWKVIIQDPLPNEKTTYTGTIVRI